MADFDFNLAEDSLAQAIADPASGEFPWPDCLSGEAIRAGREVPVLAGPHDDGSPGDRRIAEIRRDVDTRAHELNEALCAIANYLMGAELLLAANPTNCGVELQKAIKAASAQTNRAGEIVRRQRAATR